MKTAYSHLLCTQLLFTNPVLYGSFYTSTDSWSAYSDKSQADHATETCWRTLADSWEYIYVLHKDHHHCNTLSLTLWGLRLSFLVQGGRTWVQKRIQKVLLKRQRNMHAELTIYCDNIQATYWSRLLEFRSHAHTSMGGPKHVSTWEENQAMRPGPLNRRASCLGVSHLA